MLSLYLHMLKQTIDESKLIKMIEVTMRESERGTYVELRGPLLDSSIKKIIVGIEKVENLLDEFMLKKGFVSKIKNLIYNDAFGSLFQFKMEIINRFNCEEVKITTDDNIILDCLLIRTNNTSLNNSGNNSTDNSRSNSRPSSKPNSRPGSKPNSRGNSIENISFSKDNTGNIMLNNPNNLNLNQREATKEKSVMIICNPNAAPYEIFAYSDKWIEYYLDSGIDVFLWNYRGYGESKGNIDFLNMKKDAECVADFLKKFYKFKKIGVHGISLGGIPACYLAG